ncbi:transposase, partial [Macromonas bipunctata]|uniref:transposase n=1 Tax=Macromonas bipunctata TaxID=183670 RepID=UPI00197BC91F
KPLVVILDNASIHKAQAIQSALKVLQEKNGLTLYFLPPYSPELNRIEMLWHTMKHRWLEACHRTKEALERDIKHIFDNFGQK